jgi:hypothetical protein
VAVLTQHAQQKDNLCGAFCAVRVLAGFGVERWDGEPVDEDLLALRAGSLLPDDPSGSLPPGATSRAEYRYEFATVPAERCGTAAGPLAETIEGASAGALRAVPLRGAWTAEAVTGLVDAAPRHGARLVANLRTGAFWGSRPPLEALLAELTGRPVDGAPPDWDVGHFCELAMLVRGPGGALVLVHDTYPGFGWDGHHLQPPRAVAGALLRGDGREGGVLAVVPAADAADVEALAGGLGLDVGIWDNGTRR